MPATHTTTRLGLASFSTLAIIAVLSGTQETRAVDNKAVTIQAGAANFAATRQRGSFNNAHTVQAGRGHRNVTAQNGNNNLSATGQFGRSFSAATVQVGDNSVRSVTQVGNGNGTVTSRTVSSGNFSVSVQLGQ